MPHGAPTDKVAAADVGGIVVVVVVVLVAEVVVAVVEVVMVVTNVVSGAAATPRAATSAVASGKRPGSVPTTARLHAQGVGTSRDRRDLTVYTRRSRTRRRSFRITRTMPMKG